MRYALARANDLEKYLDGKHLFLFLDLDGTLAPIASRPEAAAVPLRVKRLLRLISRTPESTIAVVSGRALTDVTKRVGLPGIIYVGNHGLEVAGPGVRIESPVPPSCRGVMRDLAQQLAAALSSVPGAIVEDKALTVSVHYRLVRAGSFRAVREAIAAVVRPLVRARKVCVRHGKKVFEVRPAKGWDKGKMVDWLLARQRFLVGDRPIAAVYIGDDVTDEDAFRALTAKGWTIRVGRSTATRAASYLSDTDDVRRFLARILAARRKGGL